MKRMSFIIGCLMMTACFTGCKSTPEMSTTPDNENSAAAPTEVDGHQSQEKVIVENSQLVVALDEQLRAKYTEMGLPSVMIDRLVETKVDMNIPDIFDGVEATENEIWTYDYRLQSKSGKVDVLIKVLPGESSEKDFHGNKVSVVNELMNILIRLNGANLVADIQNHPKTEASSRFNATSYTTGTFQPIPQFSERQIGSAGIFYKEGYGRVVVVSLMDDLADEVTRTEWITGANAVRFAEAEGE